MFEWDENKRRANRRKHGVDFLDAALMWQNPILDRPDTRGDYGEERRIAIGTTEGKTYTVVYTMRGGNIRIISAWLGGRKNYERYKAGDP